MKKKYIYIISIIILMLSIALFIFTNGDEFLFILGVIVLISGIESLIGYGLIKLGKRKIYFFIPHVVALGFLPYFIYQANHASGFGGIGYFIFAIIIVCSTILGIPLFIWIQRKL